MGMSITDTMFSLLESIEHLKHLTHLPFFAFLLQLLLKGHALVHFQFFLIHPQHPPFAVSSSATTFGLPTWTDGLIDSLVCSLDSCYRSIDLIVFTLQDRLTNYFQLCRNVRNFVGMVFQCVLVQWNPPDTFMWRLMQGVVMRDFDTGWTCTTDGGPEKFLFFCSHRKALFGF
jgi:hypothetical protein